MTTAAATRPAPAAPLIWIDASHTRAAVSSSDAAHAPYIVDLLARTCTTVEAGAESPCKGFGFRGTCRHLTIATAAKASAGPHCANRCDSPVAAAGMVCEDCRTMATVCAAQDGLSLVEWAGDVAAAAWLGGELLPTPAPEVAESTPEEIAEKARLMADVTRDLVAATSSTVAPIAIDRSRMRMLRSPEQFAAIAAADEVRTAARLARLLAPAPVRRESGADPLLACFE